MVVSFKINITLDDNYEDTYTLKLETNTNLIPSLLKATVLMVDNLVKLGYVTQPATRDIKGEVEMYKHYIANTLPNQIRSAKNTERYIEYYKSMVETIDGSDFTLRLSLKKVGAK